MVYYLEVNVMQNSVMSKFRRFLLLKPSISGQQRMNEGFKHIIPPFHSLTPHKLLS